MTKRTETIKISLYLDSAKELNFYKERLTKFFVEREEKSTNFFAGKFGDIVDIDLNRNIIFLELYKSKFNLNQHIKLKIIEDEIDLIMKDWGWLILNEKNS